MVYLQMVHQLQRDCDKQEVIDMVVDHVVGSVFVFHPLVVVLSSSVACHIGPPHLWHHLATLLACVLGEVCVVPLLLILLDFSSQMCNAYG